MFTFWFAPVLTYSWFLVVAAVVPAIFLMVKVYRSDKLEKESPAMLVKMAVGGILSIIPAIILEGFGEPFIGLFFEEGTMVYNFVLYFFVVGLAEEASKYFFLKTRSWKSYEFNCQYDGVVYAVFVALGFALAENIFYVLDSGLSVAILRAVTAIPGHAADGVFMGAYYGMARGYAFLGNEKKSKSYRRLAVIVPTLTHGAYDFCASLMDLDVDVLWGAGIFFGFVIVLFIVAYRLINKLSRNDKYFAIDRYNMRFLR